MIVCIIVEHKSALILLMHGTNMKIRIVLLRQKNVILCYTE
jgi:hypothetical protein